MSEAGVWDKRKLFWYGTAALIMAVGRAGSLKFYESERIALSGKMKAFLFFARLLIWFCVFSGLFAGIEKLLGNKKAVGVMQEEPSGKWWTGYAVLALGWLPLLLIKYPAALCWDTWGMISEYMANTYSEHQSVLYTFVMGKLIEIFMQRGHSNWGIFIFSAVHYLILVASLGYSLQILRKMNAARPVRIAVLLSYLFNPYIAGYVGGRDQRYPLYGIPADRSSVVNRPLYGP